MNPTQARSLIRATFEQPFDCGRFTQFVGDLLNHVELTPQTVYAGNCGIRGISGDTVNDYWLLPPDLLLTIRTERNRRCEERSRLRETEAGRSLVGKWRRMRG